MQANKTNLSIEFLQRACGSNKVVVIDLYNYSFTCESVAERQELKSAPYLDETNFKPPTTTARPPTWSSFNRDYPIGEGIAPGAQFYERERYCKSYGQTFSNYLKSCMPKSRRRSSSVG